VIQKRGSQSCDQIQSNRCVDASHNPFSSRH